LFALFACREVRLDDFLLMLSHWSEFVDVFEQERFEIVLVALVLVEVKERGHLASR